MAAAAPIGDFVVPMKMKRLISLPVVAFAALLLIPASGYAESILLSAGSFTVLGGTAITSTGVAGTVIENGNVGLFPGATSGITGFPPAVVKNGAIIGTGGATGQARLDLIKAQVGLAGMAPNANMSNVDLAGKTLAPGVYKFNAAAKLTGALFLDGQGRNNAFWVFQIGTALTTSINSSVTVINPGSNGGRDYGIFWNAGSAITIGANNRIAGNYLAGTSITFGATSSRGGRALALAGVTLDNNQIDAFGGPGGSDWSGGLKFDVSGAVVPKDALSFRYFGKRQRTTHTATCVIKGSATVTATGIQWRVNGHNWDTVAVLSGGRWTVTARNLRHGGNQLRLRALNAHGDTTAVQRLIITRL